MIFQKVIIGDLINYLTTGQIDSTTVDLFDGDNFISESINNKKFRFVRKQEHAEEINDNSIIPVLIIATPNQYFQSKILYKDKYVDLKTLVATDKISSTHINLYIAPTISNISGNIMGQLTYNISIDYMSTFDPYGFIAEEISLIIKKLYQRQQCGQYYNIKTDTNHMFFVPSNINYVDSGSVIKRILHVYTVRACNFA